MHELNIAEIKKSLYRDGYYQIKNFLNEEEVKKNLTEVSLKFELNSNNVGPVDFYGQTFFSNVLAHSKAIFEIISSRFVLDLSSLYLGESYRLKCQRYYESGYKY